MGKARQLSSFRQKVTLKPQQNVLHEKGFQSGIRTSKRPGLKEKGMETNTSVMKLSGDE